MLCILENGALQNDEYLCISELSIVATLTAPYGGIWQVGLKKADNNIWFCNGWQNFVEYHSICYGYFLVFIYEGNSSFHVLILDKTTTKIQYPPRRTVNWKIIR